MKKTILIWHTDLHQTKSSYRLVGVATNKKKAFNILLKDTDAIFDVEHFNGLIVMENVVQNIYDSNSEFFNTSSNADRDEILKLIKTKK